MHDGAMVVAAPAQRREVAHATEFCTLEAFESAVDSMLCSGVTASGEKGWCVAMVLVRSRVGGELALAWCAGG